MPFTQDYTTKKNVCDGCEEHCKFGASRYTYTTWAGLSNDYYYPIIGGKVIASYTAANGTTVENRYRANTDIKAIELAREISKLCANYKTK